MEPAETASLRLVPAHVERIGDSIEGLIRCCQQMASEGTMFTPRGTREVNLLFERAVEMLSPRQRAVITLRDIQGFSSQEACEILGVTEIHQRVLLHRARSHVRWECERFYRGAA